MLRFVRDCLGGMLLTWVVGIGPLCWILRDGLGPGSDDSHGWAAVVRFLFTFYWGPVLLVLVTLYALCHRWSRSSEVEQAEE